MEKLEKLKNYLSDICVGCYADCKSCLIGYVWKMLEDEG